MNTSHLQLAAAGATSKLVGIDWLMIALYFGALLCVAVWVVRKGKDEAEDYFLAGRNLSWWIIGASIFASNIGSEHIVGLAGGKNVPADSHGRAELSLDLLEPAARYGELQSLLFGVAEPDGAGLSAQCRKCTAKQDRQHLVQRLRGAQRDGDPVDRFHLCEALARLFQEAHVLQRRSGALG